MSDQLVGHGDQCVVLLRDPGVMVPAEAEALAVALMRAANAARQPAQLEAKPPAVKRAPCWLRLRRHRPAGPAVLGCAGWWCTCASCGHRYTVGVELAAPW